MKKFTAHESAHKAAVSHFMTLPPSVTGLNPADSAASYSDSVKSPSGPINMQALKGRIRCFEASESVSNMGLEFCLRLAAIKISNFPESAKKSLKPWGGGSSKLEKFADCLTASIIWTRHFFNFFSCVIITTVFIIFF